MKGVNPLVARFSKSATKPSIYELIAPNDFSFSFFVLSSPKAEYLRDKKVVGVIDSWRGKTKILHTGLIGCYTDWYYGNNVHRDNVKDLIIIHHFPNKDEIVLSLFKKFYPKNPIEFTRDYAIRQVLLMKKG